MNPKRELKAPARKNYDLTENSTLLGENKNP